MTGSRKPSPQPSPRGRGRKNNSRRRSHRSRREAVNKVKTMKKSKNSMRVARVQRRTKETEVHVKLDLDGSGQSRISTGLPLLDHMLELFARHGLFAVNVTCKGHLPVNGRH